MIHLDANFLIAGVDRTSAEAKAVETWLLAGESLGSSAVAWSEFLNGPVTPAQVSAVREFLTAGCLPFDEAQAELAAGLFNRAGRPRRLKFDCLIAAAAMVAGATLATRNLADFQPFTAHGLRLADSRPSA